MTRSLPTAFVAFTLLTVGILITGCSQQTIDSASKDLSHDAAIVKREADRAAKKAKPDLQKLNLGARVTAALHANQNLPHTIRVDASETGVFLRGSVKTEEQKKLAERIARDTLSEKYTVQNDLKVSG